MNKKVGFTLIELLIIVVIFTCIFFYFFDKPKNIGKELQEKQAYQEMVKKQQERLNLKKELLDFAKQKIPELYSAIQQTDSMQIEINKKRNALTEVLKKLNRKVKNDEDIKRYDDLSNKLIGAKNEYDKMLEEGYLQYKKFEISSDPAYEKMLNDYNNQAKISLDENVKMYKDMREKMSEIQNNEK